MQTFAVIPAAGRSVRMGQPKLLLDWHGSTILGAVLRAWKSSRVEHIVVVVHSCDNEVAAICRAAGVHLVVPTPPPAEMKHSVALALNWISVHFQPSADSAWLLAPADIPELSSNVIDTLISEHQTSLSNQASGSEPAILVPTQSGRRGHPVLFPWSLAAAVPLLADDEGVNAVVNRAAVREITVAGGAIFSDIDTPADYDRLRYR